MRTMETMKPIQALALGIEALDLVTEDFSSRPPSGRPPWLEEYAEAAAVLRQIHKANSPNTLEQQAGAYVRSKNGSRGQG